MKDKINDALSTHVNLGIVIRCELQDVPRIKEDLLDLTGGEIVYQTLGVEKLYISKVRPKEDAGKREASQEAEECLDK